MIENGLHGRSDLDNICTGGLCIGTFLTKIHTCNSGHPVKQAWVHKRVLAQRNARRLFKICTGQSRMTGYYLKESELQHMMLSKIVKMRRIIIH